MTSSLRIVVADDESDMREYYRKILPRLGHSVVAAAETGNDLIAQCRAHRPDLVITDIKMPDLDGIDAALKIYDERPVPVILVSAYSNAKLIERAEADHILGYLVKPIKWADLEAAIVLALRRFEQLETLRREVLAAQPPAEPRKP
jgi:response regulator NasT